MRRKGAAKKTLWEGGDWLLRMNAFLHGDSYFKDKEVFQLVNYFGGLMLQERFPEYKRRTEDVDRAGKLDPSLAAQRCNALFQLFDMVLNAVKSGNTTKLQNLVDAIKSEHSLVVKEEAADPVRFQLLTYFLDSSREIESPKTPDGWLEISMTLAQVQTALERDLPCAHSIDKSELRSIIKEMRVKLLPDKRGPKGPRTLHGD